VRINQQKVDALARLSGLELALMVPTRWRDPLHSLALERPSGSAYRVFEIPLRSLGGHLNYSQVLGGYLVRALRTFRPDIVHVEEEPESVAALEVVFWARRFGARVALFTWENIGITHRWYRGHMRRFTLRRVDHLIAGNRQAGDVCRRDGYGGPITVIPQFGVDPDVFRVGSADGIRHTLNLSGPVVGFVGRLVPEKGIFVLVEALARLAHLPWSMLVVGDGPSWEDLKARTEARGLAQRLTWVSSVPHQEVPRYLQAMDVLVLASLTGTAWKEQFGHVLIEAMACRVPVVGSDSGAIPEVIGDAGFVTREGDPASLAEALKPLLEDPELRTRCGALGRARVEAEFTHARIAEKTWAVYERMLGGAC
jgi:glycosyltransferase involved in cell wall biosynthesis